MTTIERCYGCKKERELSEPHDPWPQVPAPGAFPFDPLRSNRLGLCPECAEKIKYPIITVEDFHKQLGFESYFFKKSPVRIDPKMPFWFAFRLCVDALKEGKKQG